MPILQQPPLPPVPPAPPPPGTEAAPPTTGASGTPITAGNLAGLRARRSELSRQLTSVQGRRDELARALMSAEGANRTGLEQRIQVLDQRIMQIERDIAENGRLLATASMQLTSGTGQAADFGSAGITAGQFTGISIVFTIFVLFPLAIALARLLWRRASRPPAPPLLTESAQRLERLEQAVDTIAVEVERVSEGQRFLTRLLTDAQSSPLLDAARHQAETLPASGDEPYRGTGGG
ncbi:MAG TPA: hypothetical protein VFY16_11375 [Gemmatimonadaceae bacterium]|nr:hypothetical protein [Gemmatimonadaceae bacterium]